MLQSFIKEQNRAFLKRSSDLQTINESDRPGSGHNSGRNSAGRLCRSVSGHSRGSQSEESVTDSKKRLTVELSNLLQPRRVAQECQTDDHFLENSNLVGRETQTDVAHLQLEAGLCEIEVIHLKPLTESRITQIPSDRCAENPELESGKHDSGPASSEEHKNSKGSRGGHQGPEFPESQTGKRRVMTVNTSPKNRVEDYKDYYESFFS